MFCNLVIKISLKYKGVEKEFSFVLLFLMRIKGIVYECILLMFLKKLIDFRFFYFCSNFLKCIFIFIEWF